MYIVTGDPHGVGQPWIDKVEKMKEKYPNAQLVFLGDYTDRNNFNILTLDYVMKEVNGGAIALRGNHDQFVIEAFVTDFMNESINNNWINNGGFATYNEFIKELDENPTIEELKDKMLPYVTFLNELPFILETDNIIFVHAGFNMSKENPYAETSDLELIWAREEYWYKDGNVNVPIFARNTFNKTVVSGHSPTQLIGGQYEKGADKELLENVELLGEIPKDYKRKENDIYTIQYPNEKPRYFIDGGAGTFQMTGLTGNVAVLNEDGTLIDLIRSKDTV